MTKRSNEAPTMVEADCDELPLKKRIKIQADYDAKLNSPERTPLILLLPEVACALAEISDDDSTHMSHRTDDDDISVQSERSKLAHRIECCLLRQTPKPLPAPGRLVPALCKSPRLDTSRNCYPVGRPLGPPPRIFRPANSKIVLQKIDPTLSKR